MQINAFLFNSRVTAEDVAHVFILTGRRACRPVAYWAPCGGSRPQGKPTCGRTGRERALGRPPEAQMEKINS